MSRAWLQVLGSVKFDLVNPRVEDVNFATMATVLARIPRFNGQTEGGVYSVAQHCVEGAAAIERDGQGREAAAAFLLHDGHEYVMGDLAIPVRDGLCAHAVLEYGDMTAADVVRNAVKALKRALDGVIYPAAGIAWPLDPHVVAIVKHYDVRMLRTERDARLAPPPEPWDAIYENAEPVAGVNLRPWSEGYAAMRFAQALKDFGIVS